MPTTTGMKGGGYYDANSQVQRLTSEALLPWMEEAIDGLPKPAPDQRSWNFLDIGTSEGANSIYTMNHLIEILRRKSDLPVWALFDDLPTNDFNQMFLNLFPTSNSALSGSDVYSAAIGGSAFGRLVPPETLHLATTYNAIGFFESKPSAPLPHFVIPMIPNPDAPRKGVHVSASELIPFQKQSYQDLCQFYTARAQELVPGGKLLIQVYGKTESQCTGHGIMDVLSDAFLDFVEADMLPRSFYENFVFPAYYRDLDELTAPLRNEPELSTSYRIEHTQVYDTRAHFDNEFARTGDRKIWAQSYTSFLRAFTEPVLADSLPDALVKDQIVDKIYQRIELLLAENPERYEFHFISIAALLTRL